MNLTQVSANTSLPVSLSLARQQIGLTSTDACFDDLLTQYINGARKFIEDETDRIFLPETCSETLHTFPMPLVYPLAPVWNYSLTRTPLLEYQNIASVYLTLNPVSSIVSIQYYDSSNTLQTLDSSNYYFVNPTRAQAFITPTGIWVQTYPRPDAITITYNCGYTTPPSNAVDAILAVLATRWTYLESESEKNTKELNAGLTRIINQLRVSL